MKARELIAKKVGLPRYWEHCRFALGQVAVLRGMLAQKEQLIAKCTGILNTEVEMESRAEKRKGAEEHRKGKKVRSAIVELDDEDDGSGEAIARQNAGPSRRTGKKLRKGAASLGCYKCGVHVLRLCLVKSNRTLDSYL
jgi:hypothetical protein